MDSVYRFDMTVFRAVNVGWHSAALDPIFWALSYSGLGQVQFIFGLLFLLFKKGRYVALPIMLTVLVAGIPVAQGVKSLISRDRPSNLYYAIVQEPHFEGSFPSGHSTTSFAVATMLALLTWNTRWRWAGLLSLVWAACVALSRIYRGVHWPSDTMAGACFGIATSCGLWLVLRDKNWWGRSNP